MAQLALTFNPPVPEPEKPLTIAERFEAFHREHPEVYDELVALARQRKRCGFERCGAKALWEVARWNLEMRCSDGEFKLNNNFTSRYARLIMEREPDLAAFFEVRELKS